MKDTYKVCWRVRVDASPTRSSRKTARLLSEPNSRKHTKAALQSYEYSKQKILLQYVREWVRKRTRRKRKKHHPKKGGVFCAGDAYGNRTHVTAVKGPCLNRLTNGPLWWRKWDLNLWPAGYEPDALANWAIPPKHYHSAMLDYYNMSFFNCQ